MDHVTWTQIVKALLALAGAGTVVYLIHRASLKRVGQIQQRSDDA